MIIKSFAVGPLQCNCLILGCEEKKECIIVDPGDEAERIVAEVNALGLSVKYLLHTHAHFDHVGATQALRRDFSAPACLHKDDQFLYDNVPMQCQLFGMQVESPPPVEKYLNHQDEVEFGNCRAQVIHTPGHTPGSLCFWARDDKTQILSAGDTLFQNSIGRTDLWGGDHGQILASIRERLWSLDEALQVIPGHGPATQIGYEKKHNPFVGN